MTDWSRRGLAVSVALVPLLGGPASATPTTVELGVDQPIAYFGYSVARAGDVDGDGYDDVLVGAPFFDAGELNEGGAFLFRGGPAGLAGPGPHVPAARIEADRANAQLGWRVAGAGDVNGDGYDDVLVGCVHYGPQDEGAVFLFLGSASGLVGTTPATAHVGFVGDQADDGLGVGAGAGDLNGDGFDDIVLGARFYDAGETNEGIVFVFHGSATGIPSGDPIDADARIESDDAGALLGYAVGSAGDVDGDGYDDLLIGAPRYSAGQPDEGAVFLFLGSASGVASGSVLDADVRYESDQPESSFGYALVGDVDVNGDGYDDVIVGARFYVATNTGGAAFVFHGAADPPALVSATAAATQLESDQDLAWFGQSVASAGDVDGDGYGDIAIGAIQRDSGEGAGYLVRGQPSGIPSGPVLPIADPNEPGAFFGAGAAGADVDADGRTDLVFGGIFSDGGAIDSGGVRIQLPEPGILPALGPALLLLAHLSRRRRSTLL